MRICIWSGDGGCVGGSSDDADAWVAGVCEDELVGSPLREVRYAEPYFDPERGGLLTRIQPCRCTSREVSRMRGTAIHDGSKIRQPTAVDAARAWFAHVQAAVDGRSTPALVFASGEC